jgi:hypothetical protein
LVLDSWLDLAKQQLDGGYLSRGDARAGLATPCHKVMDLATMAARLRRQYFGKVGANI